MIWWFLITNIWWFIFSAWVLWEWRQMINLNNEVIELNHMLMDMMNIPRESSLYDQEEDVDG